jgi:hypothetical protein
VIGELFLRSLTSLPPIVSLWRRFPVGSVALRTPYGAWPRPAYAYGAFQAAQEAKMLGLNRHISGGIWSCWRKWLARA